MSVLRRMRPEDVAAVAALEQEIFDDAWSPASFRQELYAKHSFPLVILGENKSLLAYMIAWFVADEAHLGNIAVAPSARRQGLAKRLMESLHREAEKRGCRFVILEVRRSNLEAQELYRRYGYHTAMIRRGYYQNNGEDALIMTKPLGPERQES